MMRRSQAVFALALSLVLGLACKDDAPASPSTPAVSEEPELSAAMVEHFVHATALEQAVIDGELEQVVVEARWLVEQLPKQQLPDAWAPHVERMQLAAKRATEAEELGAAALATGEVIASCGACHTATGRGPSFGEPTPVPEGESSAARMARHQWAAQRMREGVIGPSDQRWLAGAGAVSVAPPQPCPIEDAEVLAKEVLDLRERIYELGAKAVETEGLEARAAVYGEFLGTCAGCHVGGC